MFVGQEWANQTFVDLLGNHQGQVTMMRKVMDNSQSQLTVSVWAANTI